MREVATVLAAPAAEAFRLLEDPRSFERLVAGVRRIRRFDPRWPEKGTVMHHTVGVAPLLIRDTTEVLDMVPGRLLRLDARIGSLGSLLVEFEFSPEPDGCRLAVREATRAGPISRRRVSVVAEAILGLRNRDICRRYRRLVEMRRAAVGVHHD